MAAFNVTADDSSPLIIYSAGGWTDTPTDDPLLSQFTAGSIHTTSVEGAWASFDFVGTGVYLFGSRRPNYGDYTVIVDGKTIKGSANAQTPALAPLASFGNLPMGAHTLQLINDGGGLDLDQIIIETQVGQAGDSMTVTPYDDMDPAITYLPTPSTWTTANQGAFLNNSLHSSRASNAAFSLNFTGEALALFGTTSSDNGNFTVSIDNGNPFVVVAKAAKTHTQTLTYFTSGLSPGQHMLMFLSQPASNGPQGTVDLDQIAVFSGSTGTATSAVAGASSVVAGASAPTATGVLINKPSSEDAKTPSSNKGLLIGAIVGSLAGLLVLLALGFMLWRLCSRRRDAGKPVLPLPPKLSSLVPLKPPGSFRRKSKRESLDLPFQAPPADLSPDDIHPPPRASFDSHMTERSNTPLRGAMFPTRPSRESRVRDSIISMYYATDQPSPRRGSAMYNDPSERV